MKEVDGIMKLILLSGGSGKRLWPLSNDQRSKQFIKVLRNEDHLESMVQRVWRQLGMVGLQADTYIATGANQASILKAQLGIGDDQIITEPSRRDTFPAISLASTYLHSVVQADLDETVVVLPVDPFVNVEYFKSIINLDGLLNETGATLGLVGIKPTLPSEKYGYIVPENAQSSQVKEFKEKPDRLLATKLIENGAVWNAGVFAFKLRTIHDMLVEMNVPTDYQTLSANYDLLPKNSFDYEYSEKQANIVFNRYDGYWKDLGTWNTLTEEMDTKTVGFTSELIDTNNTYVINEGDLPVAVIGTKDLIVAAGPEGILVSSKDDSPRVKELSSTFFESIHYVEEAWGLRRTLMKSEVSKTTLFEMNDKHQVSLKLKSNQKIVRLSGQGTVNVKGDTTVVTGKKEFKFLLVTEELA